MGDRFKGLVHPCKVYNIVAVGAPFLYIGPEESHISDLVQEYHMEISARSVRQGEVEEVVAHIQEATAAGVVRATGIQELTLRFSSRSLLPRMIATLEHGSENATEFPAPTALTAPAAERRPQNSSS
jgi:colanic acid biosynthesis glycosyl transferase WcaI